MKKYKNIKKEVKKEKVTTGQGIYNYEKIFMQLQSTLSKCESVLEVKSFERLAEDFKEKDAPSELVDFMNASIKNKIISFAKRDNLDLAKLRAISKQF